VVTLCAVRKGQEDDDVDVADAGDLWRAAAVVAVHQVFPVRVVRVTLAADLRHG